MVTVIISGDGTFSRLNKNDLEDIAKHICSKNKDFRNVTIIYRNDEGNITTHEKVLEYHAS